MRLSAEPAASAASSTQRSANSFLPFKSYMTAQAAVEASGNPQKRTPKISYGGQAVLEGVMMRGRTYMSVAVRAPEFFM